MRSRIFLLALSLTVVFGGASALAQEETTDEDTTTPETNTVFVATATLEDETNYLKYRVCSLNDDNESSFANCQAVLDNFGEEDFSWTTLEGVEQIAIETNGDGELNHGSYVSAFAEGYEGQGKGCLLRYIAQSDWGKEDSEVEGSTLLIEAETFCAFNGKPGDGDTEVEGEDEGNGPPPWAGNGKPDWAGNDDESEVESDEDAGGPPAWAGTPGGPKNADS